MKASIIGGGLAGTSCAYVLNQYSIETTIYEAGETLASGSSGNASGLYNPRLSASLTPESMFYSSAFAQAIHTFKTLDNIDWNKCGALHLLTDETRRKRYEQTVKNWNWHEDHMCLITANEASKISGIEIHHDALYLSDSGTISPQKLCHAYAANTEIKFNTKIENLSDIKSDIIILASGMHVQNLTDIPMQSVRGQITEVRAGTVSKNLKTNLCYGGYFTPAINNQHWIGSTFQRWLEHTDILPEDDTDNIQKLADLYPELAQDLKITGHRAALRATTKDHFPLIGHWKDNIYISAAHGSHGILSTLAGAQLLADMIGNKPLSQPLSVVSALCPRRFFHAKNAA